MRFVSQLMENEESISENTIIVSRIAGVQEIQRYAVCNSSRRKLGNLQSDLSVCDSCGLSQIKTAAAQHEIHNLRIFNSSVKNRKYKASSLRTSSAFRKDAYMPRARKDFVKDSKCS